MHRREFMLGCTSVIAAASMAGLPAAANQTHLPPGRFVLNSQSQLFGRSIGIFDADGYMNPKSPVIHPSNSGLPAGASQVAWPSAALLQNDVIRIYVHRYFNGAWRDWAFYESGPGDTSFSFAGTAIEFIAGEVGIGPGSLFLDPSAAEPWCYIFLSSKQGNTTELILATSPDGKTWTRQGPVNPVSENWETGHRSPNYMAKFGSQWALHYSCADGNNDLGTAHTAVAFSSTPNGPYTNKQVLATQNNIEHQALGSMYQGLTAFMPFEGTVRLEEPHLLAQFDAAGTLLYDQVVRPMKQIGQTVYFEHLPRQNYTLNSKLIHFGKRAFGFKFVWQEPSGEWKAWATCQGMIPGHLREYVALFAAPSHTGPWTFAKSPIAFKPWTAWGNISNENPAPILDTTQL